MRHGHPSPIRWIATVQRSLDWQRWSSRRSEPTGRLSSFTQRRTTPPRTRPYLRGTTDYWCSSIAAKQMSRAVFCPPESGGPKLAPIDSCVADRQSNSKERDAARCEDDRDPQDERRRPRQLDPQNRHQQQHLDAKRCAGPVVVRMHAEDEQTRKQHEHEANAFPGLELLRPRKDRRTEQSQA